MFCHHITKRCIPLTITLALVSAPLLAQEERDLFLEVMRAYNPSLPNSEKITLRPKIAPDSTTKTSPVAYKLRTIKPISSGYRLMPIPPAKVRREAAPAASQFTGYAKVGLGYSLSTLVDAGIGGSPATGLEWLLYANHYGSYGDISNAKGEDVPTQDIRNDIGGWLHKAFDNHTLTFNIGFAPYFMQYYGYNTDNFNLKDYEKYGDDTIKQQYLKTYAGITFDGKRQAWTYGAAVAAHDLRAKNDRNEDALTIKIYAEKSVDSALTIGADADVEAFIRSAALAAENHTHFAIAPYAKYGRTWWNAAIKLNFTIDNHHTTQFFFFPTASVSADFLDGMLSPFFQTNGRYRSNTFAALTMQNPYISPWDTMDLHDTRSYDFVLGMQGRYLSLLSYRLWTDYTILRNSYFFYNTSDAIGGFFNIIYDNGSRFSANAEANAAIAKSFEINVKYSYQRYFMDSLSEPLHTPEHLFSIGARCNLWNKVVFDASMQMRGSYYALDAYNGGCTKHGAGIDLNLNVEYRFFNNSSLYLHINNILSQKYQYFNNYDNYGFGVMLGYSLQF
jgi:hypothetical protein